MNHHTTVLTPGPRLLDPECQPWCTHHEAGLCLHATTAPGYGQVLMHHDADDGPTIALYRTLDELDLNGAEELANALLSLVAATRSERTGARPATR
jgi:hypothetical protein